MTCVCARPYCRTMHTSGSTYRRCLRCVERCESNIKLCRQCQSVAIEKMSGRMKKQAVCLQMLIKTKNANLRKAILEHTDPELIRALCECAHNILRGNVQMTPQEKERLRKYQTKLITTASTQEREREAETSTSTTDRWILTSVASSVGSLCRHTIATSTVCMILILVDQSGPDQSGPGDQGTGNCDG